MKTRFIPLAVTAALALALSGCGPRYKSPEANVILISVDTLRADHLSTYGYERQLSHVLVGFANDYIVFEHFYANGGGTLTSHMTMMTSLTPWTHGIIGEMSLEPERTTLAEQLHDAGYKTAAFTDGGWMRDKFGFSQGFDLYDHEGGNLVTTLPKAKRWITENEDGNFFLFLHTYDVHSKWNQLPYDCPEPYVHRFTDSLDVDFDGCRDGKCASVLLADLNTRLKAGELRPEDAFTDEELAYVMALYDGCIGYADALLGQLFDFLRERGLYDDTLIVVTSDHGEEFLEHGLLIHDQGGYDVLARIPLLIKMPGGRYGGTRVPFLAAMIDLMPTLLDVVDLPPNKDIQGRSLMPTVTEGVPVRKTVHMFDIIRTERWKYMALPNGRTELYDLQADPEEQDNIVETKTDVIPRLAHELRMLKNHDLTAYKKFQKSLVVKQGEVILTPQEIEELKSLGYLQ